MKPTDRNYRRWATALGLALSVVLIGAVVTSVPTTEIWVALKQVDLRYLLLAMAMSSLGILFRGFRWALLFRPHYQVPSAKTSDFAMIGLAVNAIIPGRPGDLVRLGLAAKRLNTGLVFTGSTIVAERLLDGITLLAFLALSALLIPELHTDATATLMGYEVTGEAITSVIRTLAGVCGALLVIICLFLAPSGRKLLYGATRLLPVGEDRIQRLEERLFGEIERGMSALGNYRVVVGVSAYSLMIWGLLALCNLSVAYGVDGIDLTFLQVLVLTAIAIAASSIPSAPGAWGVFAAGALLALAVMAVHADQATKIAYVLAIHVCQYVPVVVLGLVAGWREHASLKTIRQSFPESGNRDV